MFGIAIKDIGTVTLLAVRMNGELLRDLATRAKQKVHARISADGTIGSRQIPTEPGNPGSAHVD